MALTVCHKSDEILGFPEFMDNKFYNINILCIEIVKILWNKIWAPFLPPASPTIISGFSVNGCHKNPSSYSSIHPRV